MAVDADFQALTGRYRFNERLVGLETDGFDGGDWDARPGEKGGNPARWILAHVVAHRRVLLRRLGDDVPAEAWETLVRTGKPMTLEGLPAGPNLVAAFRDEGERISRVMPNAGARAEDAWGPSPLATPPKNVRDGAHFLHFHETYHLGQIGLIRRLRGKPGFV